MNGVVGFLLSFYLIIISAHCFLPKTCLFTGRLDWRTRGLFLLRWVFMMYAGFIYFKLVYLFLSEKVILLNVFCLFWLVLSFPVYTWCTMILCIWEYDVGIIFPRSHHLAMNSNPHYRAFGVRAGVLRLIKTAIFISLIAFCVALKSHVPLIAMLITFINIPLFAIVVYVYFLPVYFIVTKLWLGLIVSISLLIFACAETRARQNNFKMNYDKGC